MLCYKAHGNERSSDFPPVVSPSRRYEAEGPTHYAARFQQTNDRLLSDYSQQSTNKQKVTQNNAIVPM